MTTQSAQHASAEAAPFELKGSLFTLTVFHLRTTDLAVIKQPLAAKIAQAPAFFQNVPVVIDLADVAAEASVDFPGLLILLREHGLVPVGARNGSPEQHDAANAANLPPLADNRGPASKQTDAAKSTAATAASAKPAATVSAPAAPPRSTHNKLITQPVRSGQQIYAPDGDLIVLGAVSVGAEVLADGNIHIYGPLRGRALAGVKGDTQTRIFCQSLEAQLVSISGVYQIIEEPEKNIPVQIYYADERLHIDPLAR